MASRRRPQITRTHGQQSAIEFFTVRATSLATDARAVLARLFGVGNPTDSESNQEAIEEAEVLHPIGFMCRPNISGTVEAVIVRDNEEIHVISFNRKDGAALTAGDLDNGETIVFSDKEPKASIKFTKDGDVEIRCKSARNVKIFADGQTADKPVAHEGSSTTGHTHGAGSYTAGMTAVTGVSGSSTDSIAAGQGSQNVKVPT